MKIDSGAAQQAYAAYRNATGATGGAQNVSQQAVDKAKGAAVQRSDSADISSQSRVRAQALNAVHSAPAVRPDAVAAAKASSKVDDNSLATALMKHLVR